MSREHEISKQKNKEPFSQGQSFMEICFDMLLCVYWTPFNTIFYLVFKAPGKGASGPLTS